MGRDLTYDYIDHELIGKLCSSGRIEEAMEAFEKHRNRYTYTNCGSGAIGK